MDTECLVICIKMRRNEVIMRLHYLQHVPFENPGTILTWAKENGHAVTSTQMYKEEILPMQEEFDWLVVMGGPMNIYDEDAYPWLEEEKYFIEAAISAEKVVIGICFGGQLIADVIGGKVTRNPQKEIGWFPIRWSKQAQLSPLFSFFPKDSVVFEWHGDTFTELPSRTVYLAENDACKNQAFMYENKVFGFQFHLENTIPIIKDLVEFCAKDMTVGKYVQTPEELLEHPEFIDQNNNWMNMFLTQLENLYRKGALL